MSLKIGTVGEKVNIIKSYELSDWHLTDLINRQGIIVETKMDNHTDNRGYWVRLLGSKFMGQQDWFIPYTSIKFINDKNKSKNCTSSQEDIEADVNVVIDETTGTAHAFVK